MRAVLTNALFACILLVALFFIFSNVPAAPPSNAPDPRDAAESSTETVGEISPALVPAEIPTTSIETPSASSFAPGSFRGPQGAEPRIIGPRSNPPNY